ncbi:MAG: flagellar biosynthesis protein FlhA [Planctomycetia bacterium]|nr:flagellar biosynthesis protein FlhA [Planctomycetia bacterium]
MMSLLSRFRFHERWTEYLFPASLLVSIAIILLPLPGGVLDLLLCFNLAFSALILLTTVFVRKPLDFSIFPSLLLSVTLFRLGLNIATTRLILSHGAEAGEFAAGAVVQSFSTFVANDNAVVGFVIFLIILIIQFVVITKGAGRISEVSARFVLDGLPGKQSAIDADLQSGAISQQEAAAQRAELMDAVDFYGAMDGAGKFVRGDAIAGLCITCVNIVAGLAIGIFRDKMPIAEAAGLYTRLTIGDGLVSQIPAFLLAIAAALLATRSNRERAFARDVPTQLFSSPIVLGTTAVFLGLLCLTPLPSVPLGLLAIGCASLAGYLHWSTLRRAQLEAEQTRNATGSAARDVPVSDAIQTDAIEWELGSAILSWTSENPEAKSDENALESSPESAAESSAESATARPLLDEICDVRRALAQDIGLLLPPVRIRGGRDLGATEYRIRINGSVAAQWNLRPDFVLAIETPQSAAPVEGLLTKEPIRSAPAYWMDPSHAADARELGYDVVSPRAMLVRHFHATMRTHAAELLSRESVQTMLDELRSRNPATVRDALANEKLTLKEIHRVLQRLLAEEVSIRPLALILETLADKASAKNNIVQLAEAARIALGKIITERHLDADGKLYVYMLAPEVEAKVAQAFEYTDEGQNVFLSPTDAQYLNDFIAAQNRSLEFFGRQAVLLCAPEIRSALREILSDKTSQTAVLSFREISRNVEIELVQMIKARE